jgi:uncharacterized protein (TIGR00106 family)
MLAEFSIIPLDKGEHLSKYVARAIDIIDRSKLNYKTTAMGTLIEGDWDKVMTVIKRCHNVLTKDSHRISTTIKIDWRKGDRGALERKVQAIEKQLRRKIKT